MEERGALANMLGVAIQVGSVVDFGGPGVVVRCVGVCAITILLEPIPPVKIARKSLRVEEKVGR